MTTTVPCDRCNGEGWEPPIPSLPGGEDGPLDPPTVCRSCQGQKHIEVDTPPDYIGRKVAEAFGVVTSTVRDEGCCPACGALERHWIVRPEGR